MIKPSDLDVTVTAEEKDRIKSIMTPQQLLYLDLYKKPQMITPETVSSIEELFQNRDKIRRLELAPVKSTVAYQHYHSFKTDDLVKEVWDLMGDAPLLLAPNAYPYMLPLSIRQHICWIKPNVIEDELITFLAQIVSHHRIDHSDLILFERPRHATLQLVRGTIKDIRHVHFWTEYPLVDFNPNPK